MSRRVDRARSRLLALVRRTDADVNRACRELADALRGLTPEEIREVAAGLAERESARFVATLRKALGAAQRQGAFVGIGVAGSGGRAAARWLEDHARVVGARFAAHIHTQGRLMTRELLTTVARVAREGKSALEAARRIRDVLGHVPAVEVSQLAERVADRARSMVLAVGDDAGARAYAAELGRFRRYGDRLGRMHDTAGRLAYGMRASAQHLAAQVESAVARGRTDWVDRAVEWHGYDRRAYQQRVIARTETSRSYHEAFIETSTKDAPWVTGFRWKIEPRAGRKHDICDVLAGQDLYGMGPGVYPASKTPEIPAHPNCLCFLQPVVDTSIGVDDERPAAPKARRGATGE